MANVENKKVNTLMSADGKPVVLAVMSKNQPSTLADETGQQNTGSGSSLRCVRLNIVDAESLTSIEEVDVYTVADAVLYNTATGETILDYIDFRLLYTNSDPLPADVGAFEKGATFNKMDIKDIIEGLLYPNISSTVELSCDKNDVYMVGDDITPVKFTIKIGNTTASASLANLYKDGSNVASFTDLPSGEGTAVCSYSGEVTREHTFKAMVTFPSGVVESNEIVIDFEEPVYVGFYNTRPDLSNPVASLNDSVSKTIIKDTFNWNADGYDSGYVMIAVPRGTVSDIYINGVKATQSFAVANNIQNTQLPNNIDDTPRYYDFFVSYNPVSKGMYSIELKNNKTI